MKKVTLGAPDAIINYLQIFVADSETGRIKEVPLFDKDGHLERDAEGGFNIKLNQEELAQSIAYLHENTDGKASAADFVNAMIKTSPDILDDQVFDIAKVALKACLSRVSKQEGMYYHPLAAALAVCEDIIQNQ